MKTKRTVPLAIAIMSLELKQRSGLIPYSSKSLLEQLLVEVEEEKRPRRHAATVIFDPEIAAHPANMHEALQRIYHLAQWLKEGGTHDDFMRKFNPEK